MAWCASAPAWRIRAIEASAADRAQNARRHWLSLEMRGCCVALVLLMLQVPAVGAGKERQEELGRWGDRPPIASAAGLGSGQALAALWCSISAPLV